MKKRLFRQIVGAVLLVGIAATLGAVDRAVAGKGGNNNCEAACQRDYEECVPYCSKNPCFISCEDVLEICLSNCGQNS